MEFTAENKIFSVSEFIALLNIGLKKSVVKIVGEVGQVQFGPTGHVYFTLKDEKNQGILNVIIWKSKYDLYGIKLQEGMKIMALGHPEVYAPSGRLSFTTTSRTIYISRTCSMATPFHLSMPGQLLPPLLPTASKSVRLPMPTFASRKVIRLPSSFPISMILVTRPFAVKAFPSFP